MMRPAGPSLAAPRVRTPRGRAPSGTGRTRIVWLRLRSIPRFWFGASVIAAMIVWAVTGTWFVQWSTTDQDLYNVSVGPGRAHWFGTDDIGQDVYTQTISGLRKSLFIGLVAGLTATVIAAFVGAFAGYVGGRADAVIDWTINVLLVLPAFFILVILSPLLEGVTVFALAIFIAVFSWMVMAQVVRTQTAVLRERDFVKAARFMGVGTRTIMTRHILPNLASLLIIDATLGVVAAINAETALSYFGFGIQRPDVSLGLLLAAGTSSATTRPWLFLFPAGVLVLLLLAVSLVGDALRDAMDPRSGHHHG